MRALSATSYRPADHRWGSGARARSNEMSLAARSGARGFDRVGTPAYMRAGRVMLPDPEVIP